MALYPYPICSFQLLPVSVEVEASVTCQVAKTAYVSEESWAVILPRAVLPTAKEQHWI
jgi:hypothetical protein